MTQGIYCYIDTQTNFIIYIGKDSYIHNDIRHKQHFRKSFYNKQIINKILQNNPKRYEYKILEEGDISQKLLNALEISFIQKYNPKFNFTKGGDGTLGFKHSKETIKKMLKNRPDMHGENNPMFGKKHSLEARKKISEKRKGVSHPGYTKGRECPLNQKIKTSKTMNTSGYFRVGKHKDLSCKQGFKWVYHYKDENGKIKRMCSVDLKKLEKRVKQKNLPWKKL